MERIAIPQGATGRSTTRHSADRNSIPGHGILPRGTVFTTARAGAGTGCGVRRPDQPKPDPARPASRDGSGAANSGQNAVRADLIGAGGMPHGLALGLYTLHRRTAHGL